MNIARARFSAVFIAICATGFAATPALAVPLVFDFSGAVLNTISFDSDGVATQDFSVAGQTVAGRIRVETGGLTRDEFTDETGWSLSFIDSARNPANFFTSTFSINGTAINVQFYPFHSGSLRVIDSAGPVDCGDGCSFHVPDQMSVGVSSSQLLRSFDTPDGTYLSRNLGISSYDSDNPFDLYTLTDEFEASDFLDLLLGANLFGAYSESSTYCVDASCVTTGDTITNFSLAALTRRLDIVTAVEPGTLLLSGLGLMGLALQRRRLR